jgi:hypothetical protein
MSKISITPNATGTGVFTISSPATNTNRSLTLPDEAGTVLTTATAGVPVNGPAFSAYATATQTFANNTYTKIVYDSEDFDTNSNFATNRFTPNVAGYYQINAGWFCAGAGAGGAVLTLYKNGSLYVVLDRELLSGTFNVLSSGSCLAFCNGSTDFLEIYGYQNSGGTLTMGNGSKDGCWFNGALVRSAT